jgi:hypothetical protein
VREDDPEPALPRHFLLLILLFDLLFLVLFLTLAACSRMAADDFMFLGQVQRSGAWGTTSALWRHWTGRWVSSLLISTLVETVSAGQLLGVNVLSLLMMTGATWFLIRVAFRYPRRRLPRLVEGSLALAASGLLFLLDPRRGETWFWLSGSVTYLWPIAFALAGLTLLLRPPSPGGALGAFLLTGAAAGCNESLAFLLVLLLATALCVTAPRPHLSAKQPHHGAGNLITALLGTLVSAGLMLAAPGNHARRAFFPLGSVWGSLPLAARSTGEVLGFYALHRGHALLLAMIFGALAGRHLYGIASGGWKTTRAALTLSLAAVVPLLTFLSVLPAAVSQHGPPPARAWEQISVFLMAACLLFGASHSPRGRGGSAKTADAILTAGLLGGTLLLLTALAEQAPRVTTYAAAYDSRYRLLLSERAAGRRTPLALAPLPDSGWLRSAEIAPEPGNWRNQALKEGLSLGFEVRLGTSRQAGGETGRMPNLLPGRP